MSLPGAGILPGFCYVAAAACLLLLIAAMAERGKNSTWGPPPLLTGVSLILVGAILFAGYNVQLDVLEAQRPK